MRASGGIYHCFPLLKDIKCAPPAWHIITPLKKSREQQLKEAGDVYYNRRRSWLKKRIEISKSLERGHANGNVINGYS